MIRNRNGYWMFPNFFMSPDDGGGEAGAAGGENPGGADAGMDTGASDGADNGGSDEGTGDNSISALNAEIARLKAEAAKNKAALDKATSEAGSLRKELRSKMTQEQIDAESKKEAEEAQKNRIIELEKQVARTGTIKSVMGKLGLDEDAAGNLADHLYGAADIDNALLAIQKAWMAREKALKLEYGKITGPGAGADSNSPEAQAVKRASDLGKARNAQNEQAQKALDAYMR